LIGRWLGARSRSNVLVSLSGVSIVLVATKVAAYIIFSSDTRPSIISYLPYVLIFLLISLGASAVGFWRGRKRRFAAYIQYLLSVLPAESRATLLNLAEEEAQRQQSRALEKAGGASLMSAQDRNGTRRAK
jgi:hypothetical protein